MYDVTSCATLFDIESALSFDPLHNSTLFEQTKLCGVLV